MKVMICEEDSNRAKVIRDLLQHYKLKLITLTKGSDLIKQVQAHMPSVLIVKDNFSHKPARDVLERLRTNPATSKIPVIFISDTSDLTKVVEDFSQDNMVEWMQEPFKIKKLRHYVDRWTTFRSLYVRQ